MSGLSNANGFSVARTSSYTELQVASLNVASGVSIGSGTLVRNGVVSKMVTGYSPTTMIGSGAALNMNNVPGLPADPAAGFATALSTTLVMPPNIIILAAYASGNLTGSGTFVVATTSATPGALTMFNGLLFANVEAGSSGAIIVADSNGAALQYGTAGTGAGTSPGQTSAGLVQVTASGTTVTGGTLKVVIEYLQLPFAPNT